MSRKKKAPLDDATAHFMKAVGSNVRKIRRERNLTQRELGDKVNLTYSAISYIEKGQDFVFSALPRIADALDVPPTDLLPKPS